MVIEKTTIGKLTLGIKKKVGEMTTKESKASAGQPSSNSHSEETKQ